MLKHTASGPTADPIAEREGYSVMFAASCEQLDGASPETFDSLALDNLLDAVRVARLFTGVLEGWRSFFDAARRIREYNIVELDD